MYGLYVHIPFCIKKCKYCDFISYEKCDNLFFEYIGALKKEMSEYKGSEIDTVFVGGGTPTVFSPIQLEMLLSALHDNFSISDNAEFTFEANPGTLTSEKLDTLLSGGVNRLSIGVQSFNDNELKAIGRIHNAKGAYDTVLAAHKHGFNNINIDLMTSLPFQSRQSALESLQTAAKLPITHISAYSLIVEDGTPLKTELDAGSLIIADEDEDRDIYAQTTDFLQNIGFFKYEISNFSKPGYECKHNIKYWECREYIGLGTAAHSFMDNMRYSNSTDLTEYMSENHREYTPLTDNDKISEFMMMGLRMTKGVSEAEFKKRFGACITDIFEKELRYFEKAGALKHENGRYFLSRYGMDVANTVMCEFILP